MASISSLTTASATRLMTEALKARIELELEERIREQFEPIVKASVKSAAASLMTAIDSWRDPGTGEITLRLRVNSEDIPL